MELLFLFVGIGCGGVVGYLAFACRIRIMSIRDGDVVIIQYKKALNATERKLISDKWRKVFRQESNISVILQPDWLSISRVIRKT
jgi:hypothetical protein